MKLITALASPQAVVSDRPTGHGGGVPDLRGVLVVGEDLRRV
jgi:hypothetical protein